MDPQVFSFFAQVFFQDGEWVGVKPTLKSENSNLPLTRGLHAMLDSEKPGLLKNPEPICKHRPYGQDR
jgi:hypothetical protein